MTASDILARAADEVHRLLKDAGDRLTFNEETLTQILILEIARAGQSQVEVYQWGKKKESLFGADFELFVNGYRYCVQAKKLYGDLQKYGELRRVEFSRKQKADLEKYASENYAVPIYCLYNFVDAVDIQKTWRFKQKAESAAQFACTICRSNVIEKVLSSRGKLNNFHGVNSGAGIYLLKDVADYPWTTQKCEGLADALIPFDRVSGSAVGQDSFRRFIAGEESRERTLLPRYSVGIFGD